MNEKISVSDILDTYEKRFVRKALEKNFYIPSENDIENIKNNVKKMIGYNEALIPEIKHMKEEHSDDLDSFILSQLSYTTWDGVCASASLYMPKTDKKIPLAFLVCGHGEGGRLYYCYRRMAEKIASLGIAVIVPDNIGQGDRKKNGAQNRDLAVLCRHYAARTYSNGKRSADKIYEK